MLDVLGQAHPRVFASFVDRERRRGKAGVRKGADRNGHKFLPTLDCVVNRCAAGRTKVERNPAAGIAQTHVLLRPPFDRHALPAKTRLSAKDAAGTTLTRKTVTNRQDRKSTRLN